MKNCDAALESKFDHMVEAKRLLVWAKRATQVCSAGKLNQLAEQCAMSMDMEAFEQGDQTGEHLEAYLSEEAAEREDQAISAAAGSIQGDLKAAQRISIIKSASIMGDTKLRAS